MSNSDAFHPHPLKALIMQLIALAQRYPWAIALFGFVSGTASYFMVERSPQLAQFLTILLLVSWLVLLLEKGLRVRFFNRFGLEFPPSVMHYLTQLVHQESLFFTLPFFLAVTTWDHGQSIFTIILMACALVSVIDPIYYQKLAKRRELFLIFHSFALFAMLVVALPIILQLTTTESLAWALLISLVLSLPSLAQVFQYHRWWRLPVLILLLTALAGTLWQVRSWIPPAALQLIEISLSQTVDREALSHGKSIERISENQLKQTGLYAWTAVNAPRGLRDNIHHIWLQNGEEIDRITLKIEGGREEGYRAYSYKNNFPENAVGRWQIRVVTDSGQLIGLKRFTVTD
ncbi:MAG TPA: DUF5924 family protein [Methylophaga sp.]|nr:DUF5924 family protein [Methylophaga sp.]